MTASPAAQRTALVRSPKVVDEQPAAVPSRFVYWAFLAYMVLEFARPPLLPSLRLQMVFSIAMPLVWLGARDRPWSNVLTAQVCFLLLIASQVPFVRNNFAAFLTARTLFGCVAVGVVLSWLFSRRAGLMRFYWCWLLIMSYVAVFGIVHGGTGPGGFLGDENDLALGCVSAFPFAFYGFERLAGRQRWLAGACGALLLAAIVVSFSRGGFLGLLAASAYCYVNSTHKLRNLVVALVACVVLAVAAPASFWKEMGTIDETDQGTAESRQFLWATAVNMWEAHPVLGVGGGNFAYSAGRYQPRGGKWDDPRFSQRDWTGTVTHSTYFQLLSEVGLAGLVPFSFMVVGHFLGLRRVRRAVRRQRNLAPEVRRDAELITGSLAGGMIGVLAAGTFLSAGYYPYFYFFSGVSVAAAYAFGSELSASVVREPERKT